MVAELLSHTLLGQYRLEAFISATPQGEFYRATDLKNAQRLGVTALTNSSGTALPKISHPAFLPALAILETPEATLLLEPWVDGPSLRYLLETYPGVPFSLPETLAYAKAISAALQALHKQGYLHNGLCPERVHLNKQAGLLLSGAGGCRPLASPADAATDQYALASLLYELLTRQPPQNPPANPRNLNPEVPDYLARILLQALSPQTSARFASVEEFFLSLCLAARQSAESLPGIFSSDSTPLSRDTLQTWESLPPLQTASAPIPLRPVTKENISAAGAPPRKPAPWAKILQVGVGILTLAAIFFLLSQIQPLPTQQTLPPPKASAVSATLPTAAPTFTLPPEPTRQDGGRIVFTCTRGDYNQLCMIRPDGRNYQQITNSPANNYYPTFAPGGEMLVFASNRFGSFDLFLLLLNSGNLSQLTQNIGNAFSPSFSPDGFQIVFANRAAEGPTSLWVTNREGSNPRLLYAGANTIVNAAWSPDGSQIAFAMSVGQPNEFQVFLLDVQTEAVRQVQTGLLGIGGSLDWSPDGKNLLVFAGAPGDKDIYRLEIETGNAARLTSGGNNSAAAYSPDGAWVVFNSLRNNEQADLYIMRADGSELRQLTDNPEPDWQPRWEP